MLMILRVVPHGGWRVLNTTVRKVFIVNKTNHTRMLYIQSIIYILPKRELDFERLISWYIVLNFNVQMKWWFVYWYWRNCFCHHFFHDISEFDVRHVTSYSINILSRKTWLEFSNSFFLTFQIGAIVWRPIPYHNNIECWLSNICLLTMIRMWTV